MARPTTIYFCSDIHGSDKCFRKFLNAGRFYGVNALIMGGDLTGKQIIALERQADGRYTCDFQGRPETFDSGSELDAFTKRIRDSGRYVYLAEPGEMQTIVDQGELEHLFERLMAESMTQWLQLAEDRLKGTGIACYLMPGNDDPDVVADLLNQSTTVNNLDGHHFMLDEVHEMVGLGYSNQTPWNTFRELTEEAMVERLQQLTSTLDNPRRSVVVVHVPPYASGLDDAPVLDENLTVQASMGQVRFKPVGSQGVRQVIEQYQPMLSLHGHIHESHAAVRIGKTLSVNPGSDYGEGVLHGFLATLGRDKVERYQLVSG